MLHCPTPTRIAIGAITAVIGFAACSVAAADSSTEVTGTNDACVIATQELSAGTIDFEFTNQGDDVSELYVVRANGDVVGEVENVTTGTTRSLTVDLVAGDYQVRCKPGQTGDGITSDFSITGDGGTAQAAPDMTIAFESVEFTYNDLDLSDIVAGNTIRFEMTNAGAQEHEFEVLDVDGVALGEVAAMGPGQSGGATITFESAGVYTYQCILVDDNTDSAHTELGMIGTFEVPES